MDDGTTNLQQVFVAWNAELQAELVDAERQGLVRRTGEYAGGMDGNCYPCYAVSLAGVLHHMERKGLVVRTGEFRDGLPVYALAQHAKRM